MKVEDLFPKLIERTIPVSALDISPRVFLNWKKEGIIDLPINTTKENANRKTDRKWAYLNFFDALWLLIVIELRKSGIDLKSIIELKKFLYDVDFLINLLKDLENEELKSFFDDNFAEQTKELIDYNQININSLIEYFNTIDSDYKIYFTQLSNLFTSVLIFKQTPSIQMYRLPQSNQLYFDVFIEQLHMANVDIKKTVNELLTRYSTTFFINIPILPFFEILLADEKFEKHNANYELFNYREQKILKLLRDDDYKEITIKKGSDGFLHLESKSQLEFKNEKAKEIRKIMGLKDYDRIDLVQRNDKHIIINKTNKEKI